MRIGMIALALLATVSTMAQQAPVLDGKANLTGPVADSLAYSAPVPTKESVRSLIISYINRPASTPQTPEEKDFFAELASGAAVEVTLPGKTVNLPPLSPEPLKLVKLLLAPPNLNTLWKQPGEPTLLLIEFSRWGDRGRNRVTGYMANMLYGAWSRSTVKTAYSAFVSEYAGISNAITEQIALFDEILGGRLVSVQNRFSPIFQSSRPELDYTVEHGMAFLPWSPLGGIGNGSEVFDSSAFAAVGAELGVSAQQVALAWELSLGDSVIPIPGASRPASITDSALASELVLTPEQLARLGA